MFEFKNISFKYESGSFFLQDINLSINSGEIILIAGPSCSGKTTLGKLAAGLLAPIKGEISQISPLDLDYIPENAGLISNRTLIENMVLKLRYHPELREFDSKDRIDDICNRLGIAEYARSIPSAVPSSIRIKTAVARAVLSNPKLIILDGIVHHVDISEGLKLLELLSNMKKQSGTSFLVLSGHLSPESGFADKVGVLKDGNLSFSSNPHW